MRLLLLVLALLFLLIASCQAITLFTGSAYERCALQGGADQDIYLNTNGTCVGVLAYAGVPYAFWNGTQFYGSVSLNGGGNANASSISPTASSVLINVDTGYRIYTTVGPAEIWMVNDTGCYMDILGTEDLVAMGPDLYTERIRRWSSGASMMALGSDTQLSLEGHDLVNVSGVDNTAGGLAISHPSAITLNTTGPVGYLLSNGTILQTGNFTCPSITSPSAAELLIDAWPRTGGTGNIYLGRTNGGSGTEGAFFINPARQIRATGTGRTFDFRTNSPTALTPHTNPTSQSATHNSNTYNRIFSVTRLGRRVALRMWNPGQATYTGVAQPSLIFFGVVPSAFRPDSSVYPNGYLDELIVNTGVGGSTGTVLTPTLFRITLSGDVTLYFLLNENSTTKSSGVIFYANTFQWLTASSS